MKEGDGLKLIIMIVLIAAFGIYSYLSSHNSHKQGKKQHENQKTVQDFMNVMDIDQYIHTKDQYLIGFLHVSGRKSDLLSDQEKRSLTAQMTADVSTCNFPWQILAVSQPEDNSDIIYQYQELLEETDDPMRKKLLREAIRYQNELMLSGESMERQIYIKVWEYQKDGADRDLMDKLQQLTKSFDVSGYSVEVLRKNAIIRLCHLIHNPMAVLYEADTGTESTVLPRLEGER